MLNHDPQRDIGQSATGRCRDTSRGGTFGERTESYRAPTFAANTGSRETQGKRKRGQSVLEVMLVVTVIAILISMSTPSFNRSIEQSHADVAGANLRAIWNAQRLYWLDSRFYASSLNELESLDLIDPMIVSGSIRYSYSVTFADASGFTAVATRTGSSIWSGQFVVDETGQLTGTISSTGASNISPGFQ